MANDVVSARPWPAFLGCVHGAGSRLVTGPHAFPKFPYVLRMLRAIEVCVVDCAGKSHVSEVGGGFPQIAVPYWTVPRPRFMMELWTIKVHQTES